MAVEGRLPDGAAVEQTAMIVGRIPASADTMPQECLQRPPRKASHCQLRTLAMGNLSVFYTTDHTPESVTMAP
jgi:hypothetical protein